MSRRTPSTLALAVAVLFAWGLALVGPALAAAPVFTNGQEAALVLGQPNFYVKEFAGGPKGMRSPSGVAVDPLTGKVFVADSGNHRVLRFASVEALVTGASAEGVLGQVNFENMQAGTARNRMSDPYGLVVDSAGRLWVSETDNNRVLRFDNASSKPNGANADGVLGQTTYTSNTRTAARNRMSDPYGLAVDNDGRLWVADTFNNRVLRFDNAAAKANGADADGVFGQLGYTTAVTGTTASTLYSPGDVVVDGQGRLWVSDTLNHRLLRFDNAAAKANGANADGVLGQANFTSAATGTAANRLSMPGGMALDGDGRLWVADSSNLRVLRFDGAAAKANGANADGVIGQSNFTARIEAVSPAHVAMPLDVALDSAGQLWVAEYGSNRVSYFTGTVTGALTAAFAPGLTGLRNTPLTSAGLTFSVAATGLDVSDFTLTRNGAVVDLSGATVTGSGTAYTLGGLETATTPAGSYVLTLRASGSGIQAASGATLTKNVSVAWTTIDGDISRVALPIVVR